MATYYVGPGGNNTNDGLSWANRKLTLNGAEDIPVAPGDTVYVGPGVYRELLTTDVSGTLGNIITYIGDVTGANTDGVGGVVRITGSDDDLVGTRNTCVSNGRNYRTFRGFRMDGALGAFTALFQNNGSNVIVEDCVYDFSGTSIRGFQFANVPDSTSIYVTIRRCIFLGQSNSEAISMYGNNPGATVGLILVENCLFLGRCSTAIFFNWVSGVKIQNCHIFTFSNGIGLQTSVGANSILVYNSLFTVNGTAISSPTLGAIVEDYNNFVGNGTDRNNVAVGANSTTRMNLLQLPTLFGGITLPAPMFGTPSQWTQIPADGSDVASEDLLGTTRPATVAKRTKGPVQQQSVERATNITNNTSAASLKLPDAALHQLFLPISAESTTITVQVYREADYAGTLPQLVVKQPGQADQTATDVGAAGQWNQLTVTLTPAAAPPYVVVELVSNNTASAGSYAVYWDDVVVT